tara:strand:+ start:205 stop:642 length:438 start_codon:yes stop_codon:yes gene_type:complete
MSCKIQIFNKHILYIILILSTIFINLSIYKNANASNYDIENIVVFENFNKDFKKEQVFDKAFKLAFDQLIFTLLTSKDIQKIQNTNLFTIKRLINSFNIKNEKFINNDYSANFTVSFNKKNTLTFFEKKIFFLLYQKKLIYFLFQ